MVVHIFLRTNQTIFIEEASFFSNQINSLISIIATTSGDETSREIETLGDSQKN